MRTSVSLSLVSFAAAALLTGCLADSQLDNLDDHDPALAATKPQPLTTRSAIAMRFDALLYANGGSACGGVERVCVIHKPLQRVLRIGDAIQSRNDLDVCGSATGVCTPPSSEVRDTCVGLAACIPMAANCPPAGDFACKPIPGGSPGLELVCGCG